MTTARRAACIGLAAGLGLGVAAGRAQHVSSSSAPASHPACLEEERQALERGEGFGMALAADRHGYAGPKHILELRAQLELTPVQQEEVERLFNRLRAQALDGGKKLLEKEAELERLFASGAADTAALRRLLDEIAKRRAELRWVHLTAHLEAADLLTPEQRARYHQLRHGPPAR